jgi:hypothetical protein
MIWRPTRPQSQVKQHFHEHPNGIRSKELLEMVGRSQLAEIWNMRAQVSANIHHVFFVTNSGIWQHKNVETCSSISGEKQRVNCLYVHPKCMHDSEAPVEFYKKYSASISKNHGTHIANITIYKCYVDSHHWALLKQCTLNSLIINYTLIHFFVQQPSEKEVRSCNTFFNIYFKSTVAICLLVDSNILICLYEVSTW